MKYGGFLFVAGWLAAAFLNVGFVLAVVLAVGGGITVGALKASGIGKMLGMGDQPYGELGPGRQRY